MKIVHPSDSPACTSLALRHTLISLPCRPAVPFEEPPLSSDPTTGLPKRPPTLHHTRSASAPAPIPFQRRAESGLEHFNSAPAETAEAIILACCGSRGWARRVVAHRPYPDIEALLAGCDEAGYDLPPGEVHEALAGESSTGLPPNAPQAAHTALAAAHAAYESRFGHAFVISLDGHRPDEYLDQVLAGIRSRLSHEPDEERAVSAEELRALARSRLAHAVANHPETDIARAGT
ncbi:2-oxo-4-hydroxy-4-carboxy-5-ureidoimidazoline decarboxylase [Streptomyces sp. NPDC096176]|uniref:2-oxo-4-hydroxy-4-carboxy-5-ureidoimidazoline decarboxylase n=1 Tax=Streptomyces sp. NPDC096176 TaxID=3366079 RepID=UPI003806BF54